MISVFVRALKLAYAVAVYYQVDLRIKSDLRKAYQAKEQNSICNFSFSRIHLATRHSAPGQSGQPGIKQADKLH
jgi:hypothetical protein